MAQNPQNPPKFSMIPKIVNGGIAGVVGLACVFPIDLVKTRLQNQPIGPNGEVMYTSILDCFRKTFKAEGFFGMYRGYGIIALLITPEKSIKFSTNDLFRHLLTLPDGHLSLPRQSLSGALAAMCQTVVTTPMELIKIQMQDAGRKAAAAKEAGQKSFARPSTPEIIHKLYQQRGLVGFFKGIYVTTLREVAFNSVYFPMFFFLNEFGPRQKGLLQAASWVSFCSGYIAAGFCAFIMTPIDVVKTRLQAQVMAKVGDSGLYSGALHCITHTYTQEGVRAFFKGGLCRVFVIAPLYGVIQVVYYLGVAEKLLGYPRH